MPIDQFSLASVPIHLMCGGTRESHASAFFYRKDGNVYLITNWHVLSGRRTDNGQPIDNNTAATPQSIKPLLHVENALGLWSTENRFSLYSESGAALWLQHPVHGQKVDIAVLKVVIPLGLCVYPINEMPTANIRVHIGMDVFVLGFPIKLFTGIFPIWKRGTMATEPDILIDGMRKFLIDTATQKGMSGSPVIMRESTYIDDESGGTTISTPPVKKFLGVYSGRHNSDNPIEAQLGVVWRKELIDEIIAAGVPGRYEIR